MTTRKYPKEVITMVETFKKFKNEEKSLSLEFKIPNEYYDHDRGEYISATYEVYCCHCNDDYWVTKYFDYEVSKLMFSTENIDNLINWLKTETIAIYSKRD